MDFRPCGAPYPPGQRDLLLSAGIGFSQAVSLKLGWFLGIRMAILRKGARRTVLQRQQPHGAICDRRFDRLAHGAVTPTAEPSVCGGSTSLIKRQTRKTCTAVYWGDHARE